MGGRVRALGRLRALGWKLGCRLAAWTCPGARALRADTPDRGKLGGELAGTLPRLWLPRAGWRAGRAVSLGF